MRLTHLLQIFRKSTTIARQYEEKTIINIIGK